MLRYHHTLQPTPRMMPLQHKREDAETTPTTCTGADRPARAHVRTPPGVPLLRARASSAACARARHRLASSSAPASFKQFRHHFEFSSVRFTHLNLFGKILCCMRSTASARAPHHARSAPPPHARTSSHLSFPPPCASPPTRTRARARCARARALFPPEQRRCTRGHRRRSVQAHQGRPASRAASPAAAGVSLASTRSCRRS